MKRLAMFILAGAMAIVIGCGGRSKPKVTVPGAPTGLTATLGNAQVALSWTASTGATSYNLYYSTTTGVTPANGTKVSATSTSTTVTGLMDGSTYYFIVTAVNSAGESSASAQAMAVPAAPIPPAPTGLTATPGDTTMNLSWTASAGATSYNLYFGTATGVTPTNGTKISVPSGTTFAQTGLTDGTTYYYIVTAVSSGGESAASTEASATPLAPIVAAPTALTATPGDTTMNLSWTASAGATSYNLYFGTATGVTPTNGTKISVASGTTFAQTGLTDGTTYYYIVTAVSSGGESAASTEASATPVAPIAAAPTALTATASNAQVMLSWTASAGAATYNVYYSTTAPVSLTSATRVGSITGTTYTVPALTNGTLYYFVVTASNSGGESAVSNQASATPTNGISVALTPGTAATGTLQDTATTSLIFNFPANAVTQPATATISAVAQADLPVPLIRKSMRNHRAVPAVTAADTFLGSFQLSLDPIAVTLFNVPVGIGGSVGTGVPANTTINLAMLQNNAWVDIATFIVGSTGTLAENLASVNLPGLLGPGTYLVYQPAAGTSTAISNLGVVLMADDGIGMADGSNGLQVMHIYDASGNLLPTPVISYLDYPNASDLDGSAITPDGSQGIMVDGGNTVRFFSAVQTGTPIASTNTVDVSAYGSDGDSVAILPNGDEAVVSAESQSSDQLLLISGILAGTPVATATIATPDTRDSVVISNDGTVMLARGISGLTVYSVAPITPTPGAVGGTVSHSFTQLVDLPSLGSGGYIEDGREGMAISPADPTRGAVVNPLAMQVQLLTGLTTTPVAGTAVTVPFFPTCVSISPDGKFAVVGGQTGLALYSGVDTGTPTLVGAAYDPQYSLTNSSGTSMVTMGAVSTLGITLDGKYVVAGDTSNSAILVIPFTATGFAATPASVLGSVAVSNNDQLLIH